ncbi:hypothetical protein [Vibrio gazogenes]|uniref:Uncharacterized protein n=1 Tax=Vibrio gazogenes DSM 21264 = NBRC 103151 TaxID=1123492 RepID=A0A1M4UMU0_VIBGA|nr:hypothetical protein [Vibrio gazogenes]USP15729.1 hypothetical protein MKS89_20305 [Vibrio gazogenes]SHE58036.1 hypothetical protein SAMN02745781_00509 [Vibrio gazogenes DSM 21264] [Vibrio gazogenes DSM 21264 = NBRC 103151]SJN54339.1 hypothetical protein BQ6471_00960 [Vibrio gazogenes]
MTGRCDIPVSDALDQLEELISRVVLHDDEKTELLKILGDSRARKTIPMREIHRLIMAYRKVYGIYTPFSESERNLLKSLLIFWG